MGEDSLEPPLGVAPRDTFVVGGGLGMLCDGVAPPEAPPQDSCFVFLGGMVIKVRKFDVQMGQQRLEEATEARGKPNAKNVGLKVSEQR
jgi:hypothetical protein